MSVISSSVDRIVARFGGQNAMARATRISQSTICSWVAAGRIPQARWPVIRAAGQRQSPPFVLKADDFVAFDDADDESVAA